jgi:dolichyl-phosphate beta-glucosyltransferase
MQDRPLLSVVIPAYNEERRIGDSLRRVLEFLRTLPSPSEVLVVDDGSADRTAAVVEGNRVRLLRNGVNRGKGYSLKHGVLMAEGEFVLLSDADLSTPIEELPRLLEPVARGEAGIAIGSRALDRSRIERRQPGWREAMGRSFNGIVRALTGLPFRDTQCGFKLMRRQTVLPLFRAARVERFAYDVEILYLARKAGIGVVEVPVIWRDAAGSKVNAIVDSLDMLKDVLRIVWRDRRGAYGRLGAPGAGEGTPR